MKADEIGALREQTLTEGADTLEAAASELRARLDAGGTLLALGNGGSATDATDVVADFRAAGRRALDLTEDPAIITALANDIGTDAIFSRQVIAYGGPGDALIALSTSGNSLSVIAALVEARKRGLMTIACVGYGGGRVAADELADHVIVTRSEHIPRIQEAQASAYHVLQELRGVRRVRARVEGTVQGVGFRPFVYRLASELELAGFVLNDERGVLVEVEGGESAVDGFLRRLADEAPPLAAIEAVRAARRRARRASAASASSPARTAASRPRSSRPTPPPARTACASCSTPPTGATATRSSTARTAGRASRSCAGCPTTGRSRRWPASSCARAARPSTRTPADRRFHAQPNACPECGPTLRLLPRRPARRRGAA